MNPQQRVKLVQKLYPGAVPVRLEDDKNAETLYIDTNGRYINGAIAVVLITDTGEPYCTLSVNLEGYSEELPPNVWYGKNWSENTGILEKLESLGHIKQVGLPEVPVSRYVGTAKAYTVVSYDQAISNEHKATNNEHKATSNEHKATSNEHKATSE